jgi:hypothetical protein
MGRRGYPPELKDRAVRMVAEIRVEDESEFAAMGWVDVGASEGALPCRCVLATSAHPTKDHDWRDRRGR